MRYQDIEITVNGSRHTQETKEDLNAAPDPNIHKPLINNQLKALCDENHEWYQHRQ